MIVIDGAHGEGGGQIVRSSLALAILTGELVTITNIRAGRDKPGLRPQHLTAVRAAAGICRGEVTGAEVGSTSLTFRPGPVEPGAYTFDIGTAGSTSLVLQTVLLPLLSAADDSRLTLVGGTHNPLAPTFEFLEQCYLPALRAMGLHASARLHRHGFYPKGGGEVQFMISAFREGRGIELVERGAALGRSVRALVARLPRHIAERECATFVKAAGWPDDSARIDSVEDCFSPGNVVTVQLEFEHVTEVVTALGRIGVPAEAVALEAWSHVAEYLSSPAPVGVYLADQLLLPAGWLASRGQACSFRTLPLSLHSRTHVDILQQFLPIEISVDPHGEQEVLVTCRLR